MRRAHAPEHCGADERRNGPQQEGPALRHDAREHPCRHRQHHDAEELFDRVHPGARFWQEPAGRGTDHEQRHAHAEAHRKERRSATHHVAALADDRQGGDERRRDAGGDDERRKRTHHGDADKGARSLAIADRSEACLQRRGHLQREEPKHRQCEHYKEQRKEHDDPRLLKHRLHLLPRGGEQRARDRVSDRHAEHIHKREGYGAARADVALSRDDPREDGHHRQYARREREEQAQSEEGAEHEEEIARADEPCETILLRDESGGARACGQMHANRLLDRLVAQARLGAALIGHIKRDIDGGIGGARNRQLARELAVIDLLLAEELVRLLDSRRQLQAPELHLRARGLNLDAAAVEVVAVGDLPREAHAVGPVGRRIEGERIIRRQKIAIGLRGPMCREQRIDTPAGTAARRCGGQFDFGFRELRRVAQAGVRTPLYFKLEQYSAVRPGGEGHGRAHHEVAPEDLLGTEILVLMDLALRVLHRAEDGTGRCALERHAPLVRVVAGGQAPVHGDPVARGGDGILKYLFRRKKTVIVSARHRPRPRGQNQ